MDDQRDPEATERFASAAPEAYLRRREFLQRTAIAAGLAASMATVLSPDVLVAEAASRQRRTPLPAPRNLPDRHLRRADDGEPVLRPLPRAGCPGPTGARTGSPTPTNDGQTLATHRLAPDFQGCAFNDPDHSWDGGRTQVNGGAMDGFLRSGDNDAFSVGYYARGGPALHPRRRPGLHDLRPLLLLAAGLDVSRTASTCTRRSPTATRTTRCRRAAGLPGHDDLRRAGGQGHRRALLLRRPAGVGALGRARAGALGPRAGVLRALRGRDAAGALVRRPVLR